MSHPNAESAESNIGVNHSNNTRLDGGSIIASANMTDINSMRLNGPTNLHKVEISDSGSDGMFGEKKAGYTRLDVCINFDNIPEDERSGIIDKYVFKTSHGDTLHDKIGDKVKEGMDPKDRTQLDKEEKAYDKAFKSWSMMAGIGLKPPELDDYPMLKQQMQKVDEIEKGITKSVMDGLTPAEKSKLEKENDPLGSGFAPKPMTDEVTRRVRAATKKYLEPKK